MKYTKRQKKAIYNDLIDLIFPIVAIYILTHLEKIKSINITQLIIIGVVIIAIYVGIRIFIKKLKKKKYLSSPLAAIDSMSGEEFERYLQALFQDLGYKVTLTPASNDYGVDLICKKDKETIAVQAKRYSGKVGVAAIQQVVSGGVYYHANKLIVATNSFFTKQAWNLAKASDVELWDRRTINKHIERLKNKSH